jgi:hypothetical protein
MGFIELLQIVTTNKDLALYALPEPLQDTLGLLCLLQYSPSAADFPFPLDSRTVSGLSYQLLTATAHKDCTPAAL